MKRVLFIHTKGVLTIKVQQGENRPQIRVRVGEIPLRNIVIV